MIRISNYTPWLKSANVTLCFSVWCEMLKHPKKKKKKSCVCLLVRWRLLTVFNFSEMLLWCCLYCKWQPARYRPSKLQLWVDELWIAGHTHGRSVFFHWRLSTDSLTSISVSQTSQAAVLQCACTRNNNSNGVFGAICKRSQTGRLFWQSGEIMGQRLSGG